MARHTATSFRLSSAGSRRRKLQRLQDQLVSAGRIKAHAAALRANCDPLVGFDLGLAGAADGPRRQNNQLERGMLGFGAGGDMRKRLPESGIRNAVQRSNADPHARYRTSAGPALDGFQNAPA
jgi:hypothetical protein